MKIFSLILILLMGITSVSAATNPSPRYLANQERIRIMKLMKTITISVLPGTYMVTVTDNDVIITPYETPVVEVAPVTQSISIETETGTTDEQSYDHVAPVVPNTLVPPMLKTMLPPVDDGPLHCGRRGCGER